MKVLQETSRLILIERHGKNCLEKGEMPKYTHYVVLVGDVGCGKSVITEKLTGEKGRSSDADESFTRVSETFWTKDKTLIVADTPGSNAMSDKLEHNCWIASAINFMPVSKIFIVAKAETRIDNVVDNIRKYVERFLDIDNDVVGVLVTHMDTVTWSRDKFCGALSNELGLENPIFSSLTLTGCEELIRDIKAVCIEPYDLKVDSSNFSRLFKINDDNVRIIKASNREVENVKLIRKYFNKRKSSFSAKEQSDLYFEFSAWMEGQIIKAQKRMSEQHDFTFCGKKAYFEEGHIRNMTNQIRVVLQDIKIEEIDGGESDMRKCPHCGLAWTKSEGRNGETTCGDHDVSIENTNSNFGVMGTYTFSLVYTTERFGSDILSSLQITKNVDHESISKHPVVNSTGGCGHRIEWEKMANIYASEIVMDSRENVIQILSKTAVKSSEGCKPKMVKASNDSIANTQKEYSTRLERSSTRPKSIRMYFVRARKYVVRTMARFFAYLIASLVGIDPPQEVTGNFEYPPENNVSDMC